MKKSVSMVVMALALCLPARAQEGLKYIPEPASKSYSYSLMDKPVYVNTKGVPLPLLLSVISQQAGVPIALREISYPTTENNEYMKVSYFSDGKPLRQVLDEITGAFDLWWKQEGNGIVVYKYESRTYRLTLPLLKKDIKAGTGEVQVVYDRKTIDGLENSLAKLLYDSKSKVAVSDMGFVFVFGRRSEVLAVEKAVEKLNGNFSKTIPLRVRVAIIREEKTRAMGTRFDIAVGRAFKIGFAPGSVGGILSIGVLSSSVEAFFEFLQKNYDAKLVEDARLSALNGQPIVYENREHRRIISQYQLSYVAPTTGGGPSTVVTPTVSIRTEDVPTRGSSLYIVPYYISDDTVMVDFFRKSENLQSLEQQEVNLSGFTNKVSLPTISQQANVSQTAIKKGETIVLFSSDMKGREISSSGIPFLKDIPIIGYLFKSEKDLDSTYRVVLTITLEGEAKEGKENK